MPSARDERAELIATLIARVADQRFALAPEQNQDRRYDADRDPTRQVKAALQVGLPGPGQLPLEPVLHGIEAILIDDRPDIAKPGVQQIMIGDGFRAVIDEKHESGGQEAQADKTKQESDHDAASGPILTFASGVRQVLMRMLESKGPLANIKSSGALDFTFGVRSSRPYGLRMSNPLH